MDRHAAVERVYAKNRERVKSLISDGNFYEAHQLCRTLYFRALNARKYDEASDLLYDSALQLLQRSQFESGSDLAIQLVEVLKKQASPFNCDRADAVCNRFGKLFSSMNNSNRDAPLRTRFKRAATEFLDTITVANEEERAKRVALVCKFHHYIALACWKQGNYVESRAHFERTTDGDSFGTMLAQYQMARGYVQETALFGLQAVLTLLVLGKPLSAARCLRAYCAAHPRISGSPPFRDAPLLNFTYLLLLAVAYARRVRDSTSPASADDAVTSLKSIQTMFAVLCSHYSSVLGKDSSYREQLDKIGQLYFGVPPPVKQPSQSDQLGSLLSNVFQMFGGNAPNADQSSSASASRPSPAGNALSFGSMFRGMLADMVGEENMSEDETDALLD